MNYEAPVAEMIEMNLNATVLAGSDVTGNIGGGPIVDPSSK